MKRLRQLHEHAQNCTLEEFCAAYPRSVLVVLQIHEGNLVHTPPDHEATVSHRRLPWAVGSFGSTTPNRRRSLGEQARATMQHEADTEQAEINLEEVFAESSERLPRISPSSRYVELLRTSEQPRSNILIGRSSKCDVVINDYSISKSHASVSHDHHLHRTMVTDIGSRNGTYMDEHRLEKDRPALIRSGDEVRLGRISFVYLECADLYDSLTTSTD